MTFADSYAFLDAWVMEALTSLGITATYKPLNDIATEGKIGGAAQKRLASGGMVHHVTMSYDMNGEEMTQVLRIGREKITDKGTTSAAKRVDPLRSQTGLPASRSSSLRGDLPRLNGAEPGHITDEEYEEAEALVAAKFATEEWLSRVP